MDAGGYVDKIAFAVYGATPYNTGVTGCLQPGEQESIDVTKIVKGIWAAKPYSNQYLVTTESLGVQDPAPTKTKYLTVFFNDITPADCIEENSWWQVQQAWLQKPKFDCSEPQGVIEAWWGIPYSCSFDANSMEDVSTTLWELSLAVREFRPTQSYFTAVGIRDPAAGQRKTLLVRWSDCRRTGGQGASGRILEGEAFVFPTHLLATY